MKCQVEIAAPPTLDHPTPSAYEEDCSNPSPSSSTGSCATSMQAEDDETQYLLDDYFLNEQNFLEQAPTMIRAQPLTKITRLKGIKPTVKVEKNDSSTLSNVYEGGTS